MLVFPSYVHRRGIKCTYNDNAHVISRYTGISKQRYLNKDNHKQICIDGSDKRLQGALWCPVIPDLTPT
jgi:hypothetical protein